MRGWQPILWDNPHSWAEKTLAQRENLALFQCFYSISRSHHSSMLRDHFLSPLCFHSKGQNFFPNVWQKESVQYYREKSRNNTLKYNLKYFAVLDGFTFQAKVQSSLIKGVKIWLNSFNYPQTREFGRGLILSHDTENFVNWKRIAGCRGRHFLTRTFWGMDSAHWSKKKKIPTCKSICIGKSYFERPDAACVLGSYTLTLSQNSLESKEKHFTFVILLSSVLDWTLDHWVQHAPRATHLELGPTILMCHNKSSVTELSM